MTYSDLRRFIVRNAICIAVLLLAGASAPTAAHHVTVAEAISDADAFRIAQEEFYAQAEAVVEVLNAYSAATSGPEKTTAGNAVETTLLASIKHIASLDVRECFAPWHRGAVATFELVADGFAALRRGESSPYEEANKLYPLYFPPPGEALAGLFVCDGEVTV